MVPRNRQLLVAIVTTMVLAMASGCNLARERICDKGRHVVKSIQSPETGRTCVDDGKPPPEGYEEYPPGQVPAYIDEGY